MNSLLPSGYNNSAYLIDLTGELVRIQIKPLAPCIMLALQTQLLELLLLLS